MSIDPLTVAAPRRHVAIAGEERRARGDSYPDHGLLAVYPGSRPPHPETITARVNGKGPRNVSVSRASIVVAGTEFEPVTSGF
jgi:hypothetical protein